MAGLRCSSVGACSDEDRIRVVARYIERAPLSLEKLEITDDVVAYCTGDGLTGEYHALEFMALLSCHIPKPYESVKRYYGWYSCRALRGAGNP